MPKLFVFVVIGPTGKETVLYSGGKKKLFFITNKRIGVEKLMPSARNFADTLDPKIKLVLREFDMVSEEVVKPSKPN